MSQEILGKGISISKEGINKRINKKSVSLLKDILNQVLSLNLSPINAVKSNFSSIVLTDATSFQLPVCLNDSYNGFGGNHGSRGGVKVQYQISFTDGITKTEITSATTNDLKSTIIKPKENELYLFDLGYFSLARLKKFDKKGAYYLCRLKTNTVVSIIKYRDLKLFDWQNTPKNFKVFEAIELAVCLGNKKEVKTRLFVTEIGQ